MPALIRVMLAGCVSQSRPGLSFVARALVIAVLVALATPAVAAPPVSVHARTELRLKPVRKDYNGDYVVSGTLVDRFSPASTAHGVGVALSGSF